MTTIAQARDKDRARPVYLMEITLLNSGPTLYFSDGNITVGGQRYEDYLGDLSGLGEDIRRSDSEGLNANINLGFKNDRYKAYTYLVELGETYPFEGAEVTIKETYLDAAGVPSDAETVFKGALDEPRDIDLMGFACRVSSVEFRADLKY